MRTAPPKTNTRIAIIYGNVLWEYAASLEVVRAPEWGEKGSGSSGLDYCQTFSKFLVWQGGEQYLQYIQIFVKGKREREREQKVVVTVNHLPSRGTSSPNRYS